MEQKRAFHRVPIVADREFGVTLWRPASGGTSAPPRAELVAAAGHDISAGGIAVHILETDQRRLQLRTGERVELLIEHAWDRIVLLGQVCHVSAKDAPASLVRVGMNFRVEPMSAEQKRAVAGIEALVAEVQRKKLRRRSYYDEGANESVAAPAEKQ